MVFVLLFYSRQQTCESEPKQKIIIKIMSSRSCDRNLNVMCAAHNLGVIRSGSSFVVGSEDMLYLTRTEALKSSPKLPGSAFSRRSN